MTYYNKLRKQIVPAKDGSKRHSAIHLNEELQEFYRVFDVLDRNNDNQICSLDVEKSNMQAGQLIYKELLQHMDLTGNNKVSRDEFAVYFLRCKYSADYQIVEKVKDYFDRLDTRKQGKIKKRDFVRFMRNDHNKKKRDSLWQWVHNNNFGCEFDKIKITHNEKESEYLTFDELFAWFAHLEKKERNKLNSN